MNKYSDKSDFEINKAVFRAARLKHKWFKFLPHGVVTYKIKGDWVIFDPCNNPVDAMPIILSNKIDINHGENEVIDLFGWHSCTHLFDFKTIIAADSVTPDSGIEGQVSKTIYRLAMEVFLMMKEAENAGKQS